MSEIVDVCRYSNCDKKPSDVKDFYWLFENYHHQESEAPEPDGKWIVPCKKFAELDHMWEIAKRKYREGVFSMKVSTAAYNPRASNDSHGVIIFYCGPSSDEDAMMNIAKLLDENVPSTSECLFYKTDYQTLLGTRATRKAGVNHIYGYTTEYARKNNLKGYVKKRRR